MLDAQALRIMQIVPMSKAERAAQAMRAVEAAHTELRAARTKQQAMHTEQGAQAVQLARAMLATQPGLLQQAAPPPVPDFD